MFFKKPASVCHIYLAVGPARAKEIPKMAATKSALVVDDFMLIAARLLLIPDSFLSLSN